MEPPRDTDASKAAALVASRARKQEIFARPGKRMKVVTLRPASLGGHTQGLAVQGMQSQVQNACEDRAQQVEKVGSGEMGGEGASDGY